MYVCMHVCMYVCACVHVCICVRAYVCMCMYMCLTYIYVDMHPCTHQWYALVLQMEADRKRSLHSQFRPACWEKTLAVGSHDQVPKLHDLCTIAQGRAATASPPLSTLS